MRTKEIILTGLMMLLLLTACSCSSDSSNGMPEPNTGDKGDTVGQGPAMGFSAVFAEKEEQRSAGARTRGVGDGEFDDDALQASGFGVYCWYTGSSSYASGTDIRSMKPTILMLNQKVEYKNSKWTYAPTKYWPLNDEEMLTLRAYAPYVSYQLQTDETTGLPMLPVALGTEVDNDVVYGTDYKEGTQHDPLWGTAKYGGTDGDNGTTYGVLYDNYTRVMSGNELVKDADDGIVHWYFHHGMSKLMFTCSVIQDPGCSKVTIKSIKIETLYTQGLLSLSSETTQNTDKPDWEQYSGDMTVKLENFATNVITITDPSQPTPYTPLLSKGLLIIPRNFEEEGLKVTVTYTIDDDVANELEAMATIKKNFQGNTSYILGLSLTPSTKGLEITMVQSAFTAWSYGGEIERPVYNW